MTRYRVIRVMDRRQPWHVVDTENDWGVIGRFRQEHRAIAFCTRMNKGGKDQ